GERLVTASIELVTGYTSKEAGVQDYRNLRVWQKAHQLAVEAFRLCEYRQQPGGWALRDQMLKAAISIPSNIAEGAGRGSDADFVRFLWYSYGSSNEFESDLLLARAVNLVPEGKVASLEVDVGEVRRSLTRL